MNIVLFTHPGFVLSQSMPRFVDYLTEGMQSRGHHVEFWRPSPVFCRITESVLLKKWLGYIDQYILFPFEIRKRMKTCAPGTLFVFTDQALGPWIPLAANRPHAIHCHDFLAQRSALGEIVENPTSWTGQCYQAFIRNGYSKGKHFISVSQTTRTDLHRFLPAPPVYSEVVYNGLNQQYVLHDIFKARNTLGDHIKLDLQAGYLLHVGGNQWYKNRLGIIALYNAWRASSAVKLPLLLVGQIPNNQLIEARNRSHYKENIFFLTDVNDSLVRLAYAGATVFLFPSLAEGFGWPIAEAMAAGCPVITTGEAPMTEVGGTAAFYIPRLSSVECIITWANTGAQVIKQVVELTLAQRKVVTDTGLLNATRFNAALALNQVEVFYQHVLNTFESV